MKKITRNRYEKNAQNRFNDAYAIYLKFCFKDAKTSLDFFSKNHIYSIVFNFFPSFPAKASLCVGKMIQILIFTLCKHFDHQQHNTINGILPLHKENVEYKIN